MLIADRAVFLIAAITVFAVSTPSFSRASSTCQLNYSCCGTTCFLSETNCNKTSCCINDRIWKLGKSSTLDCHNFSCEMTESKTLDSADLLCVTQLALGIREENSFVVPCSCTDQSRSSTTTTEAPVSTHIKTTPHYINFDEMKTTTTTKPPPQKTTATTNSRGQFLSFYFIPGILFISVPLICIVLAVARGINNHRRSRQRAANRRNEPRPVVGSRDNSAFIFDSEDSRPMTSSQLTALGDQPPSYDFVIRSDYAHAQTFSAVVIGSLDSSNVNAAGPGPPAYDDLNADNNDEGELPSYEEATKDLNNPSTSQVTRGEDDQASEQ